MKLLLDESVPRLLKHRLRHHQISTVQEMGWAGIRNGELLKRTENLFDVLITADQNMPYQQNLVGQRLAILVLPTNQVPQVDQLISTIESSLLTIRDGTVVKIPFA